MEHANKVNDIEDVKKQIIEKSKALERIKYTLSKPNSLVNEVFGISSCNRKVELEFEIEELKKLLEVAPSESASDSELKKYNQCHKKEKTWYNTIFKEKYYSFLKLGETNDRAFERTLEYYGIYKIEAKESDRRAFYAAIARSKKKAQTSKEISDAKPIKPQKRKSEHIKLKKVNSVHQ